MLRVGLTGGLGSGKSTVAAMLARHGAHVLSSDEIGRELMQPGQAVYEQIVATFGAQVVRADGALDRAQLARLAFAREQVEVLNAIVHPAVIAEQARRTSVIAAAEPGAVVVVESALLFETLHGGAGGWRARFDQIVLVTAPETMRVERWVARGDTGEESTLDTRERLRREARLRLAKQMPDEEKARWSDAILVNDGTLSELQVQVNRLWASLSRGAGTDPASAAPPHEGGSR